jgi:DNA-binding transcriptional LysR family regulator
MQQYTLIDLKAFETVVEMGNFHLAADRLGSSTASVSRRVSFLEKALGVRLLNRTTRRLSLTEAGELYLEDVQNIFSVLENSEDKLRIGKTAIKGTLRIVAPMSFGIQRIAPILPEFLKNNPGINIHLQFDDRQTDLYAEGIDIALRIGDLKDSALVATRLCSIERVICASPEYLKEHGEPIDMLDLKQHNCMIYSLANPNSEWGINNKTFRVTGQFSANNGEALSEAAIKGVGIALLPVFIIEKALKDGSLVRILNKHEIEPVSLYAVKLSRQFTPAKVKLMIDYLKSSLGD